jgi:hypothetical protein
MLEINKVYTLKTGEKILINEIRILPEGTFYKNTDFAKMYSITDFEIKKKKNES